MPYITQEDRAKYDEEIYALAIQLVDVPAGHVNYAISKMFSIMIKESGESYATYNALVGVLECVKLELFRTRIAPYEHRKAIENGPI